MCCDRQWYQHCLLDSIAVTPQRITPLLNRTDSVASAASASRHYTSSVSLNRSESGLSFLGLSSETEKTRQIREEIKLLEQVRVNL